MKDHCGVFYIVAQYQFYFIHTHHAAAEIITNNPLKPAKTAQLHHYIATPTSWPLPTYKQKMAVASKGLITTQYLNYGKLLLTSNCLIKSSVIKVARLRFSHDAGFIKYYFFVDFPTYVLTKKIKEKNTLFVIQPCSLWTHDFVIFQATYAPRHGSVKV